MRDSVVVCPIHNERKSLPAFFRGLRESYPGDVIVVDDGSTDGSGRVLEEMRDGKTVVVTHTRRKGYGAALKAGFDRALSSGYGKIVTIDGDLQHRPEHIASFLSRLDNREVVLGSRYIRIDGYLHIPRDRLLINRYVSRLIELLFSVRFTDPFCGYRGYSRSFLERVRIEEAGYGMGLEILMEIVRLGVPFSELPVEALYPDACRSFLDGLDDPRLRLLHYLSVIERKKREMEREEKVAQTSGGGR